MLHHCLFESIYLYSLDMNHLGQAQDKPQYREDTWYKPSQMVESLHQDPKHRAQILSLDRFNGLKSQFLQCWPHSKEL